MGIYPLNGIYRGRDIGRYKNRPARLYNLASSPGPDKLPAGSFQIRGLPNSYIKYVGKLDTVNSITVLFWLKPESSGPVYVYKRDGSGFGIEMIATNTMEVRFVSRRTKRIRKLITRRIRGRRWNYIAVTYDQRTGLGTIWRNSVPIAQRNIGRFRLATDTTAFTGRKPRNSKYFRGKISCLHVYHVALNGYQLRQLKKSCFRGKNIYCKLGDSR